MFHQNRAFTFGRIFGAGSSGIPRGIRKSSGGLAVDANIPRKSPLVERVGDSYTYVETQPDDRTDMDRLAGIAAKRRPTVFDKYWRGFLQDITTPNLGKEFTEHRDAMQGIKDLYGSYFPLYTYEKQLLRPEARKYVRDLLTSPGVPRNIDTGLTPIYINQLVKLVSKLIGCDYYGWGHYPLGMAYVDHTAPAPRRDFTRVHEYIHTRDPEQARPLKSLLSTIYGSGTGYYETPTVLGTLVEKMRALMNTGMSPEQAAYILTSGDTSSFPSSALVHLERLAPRFSDPDASLHPKYTALGLEEVPYVQKLRALATIGTRGSPDPKKFWKMYNDANRTISQSFFYDNFDYATWVAAKNREIRDLLDLSSSPDARKRVLEHLLQTRGKYLIDRAYRPKSKSEELLEKYYELVARIHNNIASDPTLTPREKWEILLSHRARTRRDSIQKTKNSILNYVPTALRRVFERRW